MSVEIIRPGYTENQSNAASKSMSATGTKLDIPTASANVRFQWKSGHCQPAAQMRGGVISFSWVEHSARSGRADASG